MIRLARLSPPHAVLCANGVGSSGFNPGPQILRQVPVFQRLQAQGHFAALLHNTDTDSGDVPTARLASPCRRA